MKFRTASVLATLVCAAQLTLFAPPIQAAEAAEPARISVAYAEVPLKEALRQFQEFSGLRLAYAEDLLAGAAPVTLRLDGAPAERVLRELLRPQGLEAILTDPNLAAVVPAWSDLGMAKAFGRALDIGLRLANKLDGATVEGDEVRVPGWTAEDDEELALGITDVIVSIAYASSWSWINSSQVGRDERVEEIRALLRSADPLVRAGALTLLANYGVMNSGIREFGREIEQGFADPHPAVRTASAFHFAAGIGNGQWQGQPEGEAATLRKLAADPEAGVRMAAALALLSNAHRPYANPAVDPDAALLDQLLADRSAFVRQTLRLGALALNIPRVERVQGIPSYNWQGAISLNSPLMAHRAGPAQQKWLALNADDGLKATLRDPNPIARAASFAFAQILQLEQRARDKTAPRDRIAEIWTEAELAKDPWMKTVHGFLAPALAPEPKIPFETLVAAVASGKASHQAAALAMAGFGLRHGMRGMETVKLGSSKLRDFMELRHGMRGMETVKLPDLAPLTTLSTSTWLWAKLAGTMLDSVLPLSNAMATKPLPPEALKAADERFFAALGAQEEPVRLVALLGLAARSEVKLTGLPPPPQVQEGFLAALRSRTVAEATLGATFAGQNLAPDALLQVIETLLADRSRRGTAVSLLKNVAQNAGLQQQTPKARLAFATKLLELGVAAQDPALEVALYVQIKRFGHVYLSEQKLSIDLDQEKTFTNLMLTKGSLAALASMPARVSIVDGEAEARILLDRLKAAAEPAQRAAVLEVWVAHADKLLNFLYRSQDAPASCLALLDKAMAGEPADARAAAARVRALPTLFSPFLWRDQSERLPANLAKALEQALASAGEAEPSALTVDLLVETLKVADNAGGVYRGWLRDAWSANHPELIQALDGAVQKVLEGPREDIKLRVWSELARSGDPMAVEALTERILDGRVPPDLTLTRAMLAVSENPGLLPPGFIPALLETIRDPAENLGRRVLLVSILNSSPGLWGKPLSEGLERLVWDDQAAVPLRSASLRMLISVLPNSDGQFEAKRRAIIRQAVASYGTLPVAMIQNNLDGLTVGGRSGEETLEEELLALVLGDKRLRGENDWMTYESLFQRLAQSRGLETLRDPERLLQALDKLEKEFPAERRVTPHGFQGLGLEQLREKLETVTPNR